MADQIWHCNTPVDKDAGSAPFMPPTVNGNLLGKGTRGGEQPQSEVAAFATAPSQKAPQRSPV
jgi:hypothetical protein